MLLLAACCCLLLLAAAAAKPGRSTLDTKKGYKTKTGSTSSVTLTLPKTATLTLTLSPNLAQILARMLSLAEVVRLQLPVELTVGLYDQLIVGLRVLNGLAVMNAVRDKLPVGVEKGCQYHWQMMSPWGCLRNSQWGCPRRSQWGSLC